MRALRTDSLGPRDPAGVTPAAWLAFRSAVNREVTRQIRRCGGIYDDGDYPKGRVTDSWESRPAPAKGRPSKKSKPVVREDGLAFPSSIAATAAGHGNVNQSIRRGFLAMGHRWYLVADAPPEVLAKMKGRTP